MLFSCKKQVGRTNPSHPGTLDDLAIETPEAQPTTFKLKLLHTGDFNNIVDETSSISAGGHAPQSHTDDPGGDIDDPGGGSTKVWSSVSNCATSASASSRASASCVSSSLTTRVPSLSLSDRSTADVVE